MRGLKILVVVLGVLLVLGSAALVAGIVYKVNHPLVPVAEVDRGIVTHVTLPAGAQIAATDVSGDRLVVRVALAEGGAELILFDLRSGARLATIDLKPGDLKPGAAEAQQ